MKVYIGIAVHSQVEIVAWQSGRGFVDRVERELPAREPARNEAIPEAIQGALAALSPRIESCEAVGLALSPPDDATRARLAGDELVHLVFPRIGGAPLAWWGWEPGALFPLYAPGSGRTWLMLDDRARVYVEGGDFGETLDVLDAGGLVRRIAWAPCTEILEPVRALLYRFGLFETMEELERTAAVVRDSAGVRLAPRADGVAIWGLAHGTRRPQVARAALEAVGAAARQHIADLAGEGAVTELCVVGGYGGELLARIISDMTGMVLVRPRLLNAIAAGAALRAAQACEETVERPERDRFNPSLPAALRDQLFARWLEVRG